MSASTRPAWGPSYCTSACCAQHRAELVHPSRCACPECQPGPGIDHQANSSNKTRVRRARMMFLILKDTLTDAEAEELDKLLNLYTID